jgi:hypothetical protein
MENEMDEQMEKLELCGVEVYALLNLLADSDDVVLSSLYDRLCGRSAMGKEVVVSLSKTFVFEGEFLAEYLEQLDDYEDTPSQREWFVLDQMFRNTSRNEIEWLRRNSGLEVKEY